jgi:hypothetical protein
MHKLTVSDTKKLIAQLLAITNASDPEEYPPLEYDINGVYLRLADGSPPTNDHLLAIHAVAGCADIASHCEGKGANYRQYRLVYLAPLETYFLGEYRWRDANSMCIRACWRRIPKTYNAQLDALRKSRQGGGALG